VSDITGQSEFEDAFHKVAERQERIWVFIAMLLLSLLDDWYAVLRGRGLRRCGED
jgi:hypothetical protein